MGDTERRLTNDHHDGVRSVRSGEDTDGGRQVWFANDVVESEMHWCMKEI